MARPRNILTVVNGEIFSVSPKNLKTYLTAIQAGTPAPLNAKSFGKVDADLSTMDAQKALSLLQAFGLLEPAPTPAPVPTAEAAPAAPAPALVPEPVA
jgi:hypothetical protein